MPRGTGLWKSIRMPSEHNNFRLGDRRTFSSDGMTDSELSMDHRKSGFPIFIVLQEKSLYLNVSQNWYGMLSQQTM